MANVVTVQNLGNEFDLGVIEANRIHVKVDGTTLVRDVVTGVISAVPGVDTFVEDVGWNPTTNELTITMNDASEHVVSLATLAADKFLAGSSFDPETNILTLTMTDGSEYGINLADLVTVQTGNGLTGDGTSGTPLAFDASALALDDSGSVAFASEFVLSTPGAPEGVRVPAEFVAQTIYDLQVDGDMIGATTGVGISGDGWATPLAFAANELPVSNEPQQAFFVMSSGDNPAGERVDFAETLDALWIEGIDGHVQTAIDARVPDLLTVDVLDAFGNHLFYALP